MSEKKGTTPLPQLSIGELEALQDKCKEAIAEATNKLGSVLDELKVKRLREV